jgi:hypothetical protein
MVSALIARPIGRRCGAAALLLLWGSALEAAIETQDALPVDQLTEQLSEVVVKAAEPRLVAPTRRDRIGRIWAPVYINDRGPFRLVLDSGANHSGINLHVAEELGLPPDQSRQVLLRGVTGSASVSTVRIDSFLVGDMTFGTTRLPIVTDPLGGADGILGTDGMEGRRIVVDFRHDLITIRRSHNQPTEPGFRTIPFQLVRGNLLQVAASVGGIRIKAIIDTGGQVTIANVALRQALQQRRLSLQGTPDTVTGVTADVQQGDAAQTPPLVIDAAERGKAVEIRYHDVTFGDMHIFEHWHLTNEPAMLIGMDALGLLDMLIIDYQMRELQVRMREGD